MEPRGVDRLEAVPDSRLRDEGQEYLAKHRLDELLTGLLAQLLRQRPPDPLQFIIDSLTLGPERADAETGLPLHRQERLLQVFSIIDREGTGRLSLRSLTAYSNRWGGEALTPEDLRGMFADFKPRGETYIDRAEFLRFFSRVSATISNRDFGLMVEEMAAR